MGGVELTAGDDHPDEVDEEEVEPEVVSSGSGVADVLVV